MSCKTRDLRRLLTLAIFALGSAAPAAAQTQPAQPAFGPGGRDYGHGEVHVSRGGFGNDAWYVFEPVQPTPAKAPVAVVMHGYLEFSSYDTFHEFIRHTVRKGSIVIYPRWQTGITVPCPRFFDYIEPCLRSATNGIRGALAFLAARPDRVSPTSTGPVISAFRSA